MDTLHTVIRSIQGGSKGEMRSKSDHLAVFREFLAHLDKMQRRPAVGPVSAMSARRPSRGRSTRRTK